MAAHLSLSIGRHSAAGAKASNQDFDGFVVPEPPLAATKGVAIALADGISTSRHGRIAAETAVKSFLSDYYCTSEAWSVKSSGLRVLAATNAWLHAETRRARVDRDRGHVCTFSAMVVKSRTAHLFHVGDARILRLEGRSLEPLTTDHRIVTGGESLLARALGADPFVEVETREVPIEIGDVFVLATDGVHEHVAAGFVADAIQAAGGDLDGAARAIVEEAFARGSPDNLTVQIVRVDGLPDGRAEEVLGLAADLAPPPPLSARMVFEGYRILRELKATHRSHIFLAEDVETGETVVLKTPSVDAGAEPERLKRFMMEEWIARRIDSAHVVKARAPDRRRDHLYVVMEPLEGRTLTQWMIDNPHPELETVRGIVEQIAKGLRAFHRKEMLHQDLRPDNVMIDAAGTVKIIDFGSTRVAGLADISPVEDEEILGTAQYTAPEYFLGERGTTRSDLFSLGVVTYQMLTGRLPYGAEVARARTRAEQRRLRYVSALDPQGRIPLWIDGVLERAVDPDPSRRQEALSEFVEDLRHPRAIYLHAGPPSLMTRHPVLFWKAVSGLLAAILIGLLIARHFGRF